MGQDQILEQKILPAPHPQGCYELRQDPGAETKHILCFIANYCEQGRQPVTGLAVLEKDTAETVNHLGRDHMPVKLGEVGLTLV